MIKFNTTNDVESLDRILGQQSATKAMELGLKIDNLAYNIYLAGASGTGKTTYALDILNMYAQLRYDHKDWCYVYNFEDAYEPLALSFDKGIGKIFKKDIEKMIEVLLDELKDAFESEDFEIGKNQILDKYEMEKEVLMQKIKKYAESKGFKMKNSKLGIVFVPIKEEEEEEIDTSTEEFYKIKRELENMAIQILYKIRDIEDEAKEAILELEEQIGMFIVDPHIENLLTKYNSDFKVEKYINDLKQDILEHIYLFYMTEEELKEKYDREHFTRYRVNLFVDNGGERNTSSAPVIVEINPSVSNLFGKAEYDSYNGYLKTDFTKLLPGAVHKANGGYLVLYAEQLLRYPLSWELLKKAIQSKELSVDTQTAIKPEAIPVDIKVVLIGNSRMYNLLYSYDSEFNKYFKILVDFESEMNRNEENEYGVAKFIASYCRQNNLKHLTYDAVLEVLKYSSRVTGDTTKLTTRFNKIVELIVESNAFAMLRESIYVEPIDIQKAIDERKNRFAKVERRIDEAFEKGYTLISTKDKKVGVINGLSVLNVGEYSFGKPARITVTTSPGNKGIVNIEREVDLSGPIHNKGVLILGGYILEMFSQEYPISLTAHICFEQNYGGVDGDSATGAEVYALISSLSDVPIKQNIAVTGSMNQKGDIQVVGGVTEKVEGFYYTCKKRGLTGDQGVILPKNNLQNLVLADEIKDSIEKGEFYIYPVERVEEAIEILTGMEFEEVKILVEQKLKKFYNSSSN